ncbi:unnamed protein product [Closterium sp. NIES-54]
MFSIRLKATETRLPTRRSARHMDQEAFNRLMAQVAEMQEGMKSLMAEVTTLCGENGELRQARGEARQESPNDEGEGNSQAVSNPLDVLTHDFEEEDRQRVAAAQVAITTIKVKPVNPPPFNPTDKTTTVKGWLFGIKVFFTAAGVNDDATRINYAVSLLRGAALEWWRRTLESGTPTGLTHAADRTSTVTNQVAEPIFGVTKMRTWREWGAALRDRFELVSASEQARMKLHAWSQMASLQDYTALFMGLADQVDDMSEAERLDKYISDLKYEIQYERPVAARVSRSAAPRITHCCSLHFAPCCSQRIAPFCSQRVAPCCPARRAVLQPARCALLQLAHRALLQPACRTLLQPARRALLQPARRALLPHASRSAALHSAPPAALRPATTTAATATRPVPPNPTRRTEPARACLADAATGGAGSGGAATGGAGSWGGATGGADSGGPASPSGGRAEGDPAGGPGAGQPP